MPLNDREPPEIDGSDDSFREYRIHRSDEDVLEQLVADVASVDDDLDDLVGGVA